MSGRRKPKKPDRIIWPGQIVLLGTTRASYPSHWLIARVLHVHEDDLLVERSTENGSTWREVARVADVRAAGTVEEIVAVERRAVAWVEEQQRAVREAEDALGRARDALWQRLDELVDQGIAVIPPDFERIDRETRELQELVNG